MKFILVGTKNAKIQSYWEDTFSKDKDIRFVFAQNASMVSQKASKQSFAAIILHGSIEGSIPLELYSAIRNIKDNKETPFLWMSLELDQLKESPFLRKDKNLVVYEKNVERPKEVVLDLLQGKFPKQTHLELKKPKAKEKPKSQVAKPEKEKTESPKPKLAEATNPEPQKTKTETDQAKIATTADKPKEINPKEKPFRIGSGFINPFTVATVKTLIEFFQPKNHKSYVPYPRVEGERLNIAISGVLEFDCCYFKGRVGLTMTEETFQELCNRLDQDSSQNRIDKSNQDKILAITQEISKKVLPILEKKIPDLVVDKAFIVRGDEHEVSGMDEAKALISPVDLDHLRVYIQYALIPKNSGAKAA